MNSGSFFGELKRRNVHKVAVAYIVGGWALAQGIAQVFPLFGVPIGTVRLLVLLIVLGFPIAASFAWLFELTGRNQTNRGGRCRESTFTRQNLDLRDHHRRDLLDRFVFPRPLHSSSSHAAGFASVGSCPAR